MMIMIMMTSKTSTTASVEDVLMHSPVLSLAFFAAIKSAIFWEYLRFFLVVTKSALLESFYHTHLLLPAFITLHLPLLLCTFNVRLIYGVLSHHFPSDQRSDDAPHLIDSHKVCRCLKNHLIRIENTENVFHVLKATLPLLKPHNDSLALIVDDVQQSGNREKRLHSMRFQQLLQRNHLLEKAFFHS
jgi:hypothetical protein